MKLQTVPAAQGARWVRQAFKVFAKQPLAYTGLFGAFMFAALLVLLLPLVGPFLLLMLLPLVSLGFMSATRRTLQGRAPLPDVFIEPLRNGAPHRKRLLQLGAVYAVATVAVIALSQAADGGRFEALQQAMLDGKTDAAQLEKLMADPRLRMGILLRLLLAALLSVPFWHAPALVHWAGHPLGKALFASTVACWRNKTAFAVYGLTWVALVVLMSLAANLLFGLLGQPQLAVLAAMPVGLLLSTVFYASLYFTYADSFLQPEEDATGPLQDLPPRP